MGLSVPRAAPLRDRGSGPLARALRTTALGRIPAGERGWATRIEARRRELSSRDAVVGPSFADRISAGDDEPQVPSIPVGGAAGWISLTPAWCAFLMRLVRELGPRSCLELGTGFGISTLYQAAALELNGAGTMTTVEGAPDYVPIAKEGFSAFGLDRRVEVEVGSITETLKEVAARSAPIEFAFVDADHTEEATLAQFDAMLPHLSDGAILVFDDVRWERGGMVRAWQEIVRHGRVSLALGMRRIGVAVVSGRR